MVKEEWAHEPALGEGQRTEAYIKNVNAFVYVAVMVSYPEDVHLRLSGSEVSAQL